MGKFALTIVLALAACKKEGEQKKSSGPDLPAERDLGRIDNAPVPDWYTHLPSDTPYAMGTIEPLQGKELAAMLTYLKSGDVCDPASMADPMVAAVCNKMNIEGLKSIGIGEKVGFVIYGLGIAPVMRVGLQDAKKLANTLEPVLAGEMTKSEENGVVIWETTDPDAYAIIAVHKDHLAGGFSPLASKSLMRSHVLSQSKSGASAKPLKDVAKKYGFTAQGFTGFADLKKFSAFMQAGNSPGHQITQSLFSGTQAKQCAAAVEKAFSRTPRAVFGYNRLLGAEQDGRFIVEMEPSLIAELKRLPVKTPDLDLDAYKDHMFAATLGVGSDHILDSMKRLESVATDIELPCNLSGMKADIASARMMFASVPKIQGGVIAVEDLSMSSLMPNMSGHLGLYISNPAMVLGLMGIAPQADGKWRKHDFGGVNAEWAAKSDQLMIVSGPPSGKASVSKSMSASGSDYWMKGTFNMAKLHTLTNSLQSMLGTQPQQSGGGFEKARFYIKMTNEGLEMRSVLTAK